MRSSCKSPNSVIPAAILSGNLVLTAWKTISSIETFGDDKQFCKSLMRCSIFGIFFYLVIFTIMAGSWGCSAPNSRPNIFKEESEYKRILEQQKQKASIAAEEESLKKIPEMTAEGYERLGDNYLREGNIDMAFVQYDKALHLEPGQTGIRYKRGRLFLKKGLSKEAKKEFQEILKTDPHNALAYEGLGRASLKMREFDEAEKNFRQAITLDAGLWQAHNFLGIIYDRRQRFEAAITEYKAAIAIKPGVGILFNNLGMSFYLKGEYDKAAEALAGALKTGTTDGKIYNNLALALCKLGRYGEALEAFRKGGGEAAAYNNIGYIYMTNGKHEEAIKALEKAIEIKPSFYRKANENLKQAKTISNTLP